MATFSKIIISIVISRIRETYERIISNSQFGFGSTTDAIYISTGTSAVIKGSKTFFKTFTGCRQGGLESPVLFNVFFMDFVLRCAEHGVHI